MYTASRMQNMVQLHKRNIFFEWFYDCLVFLLLGLSASRAPSKGPLYYQLWQWNPKGAKMSYRRHKIKPWNARFFIFVTLIFVRQNGKNCHGTLVCLTGVECTSVDTIFLFVFKKYMGKWFLALVGLTIVKGRNLLIFLFRNTVYPTPWNGPC